MDSSFKNLKKKVLLTSIIKSAVIGLSAGLFAAGAVLLILWLCSVNSYWIYSIPAGAAAALIAGGLCFLILRPTDKKVSRKYDKEYGFDEKLQTMVEFEGREGDIISLQKQDALEKLYNAPALKLKFSRIWYYIVILVLAVALFVSGVAIPVAKSVDSVTPGTDINGEDGPPGGDDDIDPVFVYEGSLMQTELLDLIGKIGNFELREGEGEVMITELGALDTALKKVERVSGVQAPIYNAVSNIDAKIVELNTFQKMSDALADLDPDLSLAILRGFAVYKKRYISGAQEDYISSQKLTIGNNIEDAMQVKLDASAEKLHGEQYPSDDSVPLDVLLTDFRTGLVGALSISGFEEGNALYDSFSTLSQRIGSIIRQITLGGVSDSELWERINGETRDDSAYRVLKTSLGDALSEQSYGCLVELYIRQELSSIFDVSFGGLTELYPDLVFEDENPGGNGGEGGEGGEGGGSGTGDKEFGSNDYVYDPITGERVTFGTILERYESAIMDGTLAEGFPEDLKNFLEIYMYYLHNGTDGSTSGGNENGGNEGDGNQT